MDANSALRRGVVMVVDDDEIVLEVVRERLEARGYTVILRQNSLGTRAALMLECPEILLLDVNMPALHGKVLARLVSEIPIEMRPGIILHSADETGMAEEIAAASGALGLIRKTSTRQAFLSQFERLVGTMRSTLSAAG
ncbi:Hypothetical protein A7982_11878 [Minicystis rosea]|nr:Hypothetical protein A7982_11878 [Minicystis rosea]